MQVPGLEEPDLRGAMRRRLVTYVCSRVREPSTWLGLGSLGTALGWSIAPEHWMLISQIGMGAGGLVAAALSDGKEC